MADVSLWNARDSEYTSQISGLKSRWEKDISIYRQIGEALKNAIGETIPDVVNEVTAFFTIFGDNLTSDIGDGERQFTIEGKLTDDQKASIIEWLKILLQATDEYWLLRGEPPLFLSLISQATYRGRIVCLDYPYFQEETKLIIPHIKVYDVLDCSYEPQEWGIFKTTKSKSQVLRDYPDAKVEGKTALVWECWDKELHDIIIDGEEYKSEPHKLGFCPIISEIVHNTPFVRDENYKEFEGEGIFAPVRNLFYRFNRYLTIESTLALKAFRNGMQFPNEGGRMTRIDGDPRGADGIISMGPNDRLLPMPIDDLKMATQIGHQATEKEIRMGTLPILELGEIRGDNTLPQITQANDVTRKRESPVIKTIERLLERISKMAIMVGQKNGWIESNEFIPEIDLELPQVKLDTKFKIKCQITPTNPLENIARVQLALLQRQAGMSKHYTLANTLKADNPDEEMLRQNEEKVEEQSPRLSLWKAAKRNLQSKDKDQQVEGALLALELGLSPEQIQKGEIPEPSPQQPSPTSAPVSPAGGIAGQQQGMNTRIANTAAKVKGG